VLSNQSAPRIFAMATALLLSGSSVQSLPPAQAAPAKAPAKKGGAAGGGSAQAATAMAQFKARQYGPAAESFRNAIAADRANSTLYYYYALCLHYNNDVRGAITIYNQIMQYFPNTDAANRAQAAMGALGTQVAPATTHSRPSGSLPSGGAEVTQDIIDPFRNGGGEIIGPDECDLRFETINNSLIFDAKVNDRPIKVIFDTGAEGCVFGKNHLAELRLPEPTGKPTGFAQGVGDGGAQAVWSMIANITVGPITRKNMTLTVQNHLSADPLLGQTFFQDFTYTIDNVAHTIHLRRKGKQRGSIYSQGANDPNAVPFTRQGNEIVVNLLVNGRVIPAIFDTGAAHCSFTRQQVQSLGITIPDDARLGKAIGIGGETSIRTFPVTSVRLGPIEKRDFDISVAEAGSSDYPLLGHTFYGDWQFTIDYEKKLIHFLRR